ncbi:hypothetical protein SAY86_024055 [Trapa natans]|uniref:NAC domain-containing protein n=1 Tax=Trapa natans TaxID=22666 RepID=A0AAN7LVX3_TRANT|nr:hypothetical protein SAY86_024055 [Trapa natans]
MEDSEIIHLPPGFRFHPTDEEIITHYLAEKVLNNSFSASAIGEANLNKCEPWDLPKRAKMEGKEWYFFSQKDRKYPTGMRTNRATESGYWKATGKDREIYRGKNRLIGMKKTLVFYRGRAPNGEKTNWVMHEYRLEGEFSYWDGKDEWVVCRIFHKSTETKKPMSPRFPGMLLENSLVDDYGSGGSLPPLVDPASSAGQGSNLLGSEDDEFKGVARNGLPIPLSGFSEANFSYCEFPSSPTPSHLLNMDSNFSMMNSQIQNPNFFPVPGGSTIRSAYLKQLAAIIRTDQPRCKVEPFLPRSVVTGRSHETGPSTDMNAEISSSATPEITSSRPLDELVGGSLVAGHDNSLDMLDFPWDC